MIFMMRLRSSIWAFSASVGSLSCSMAPACCRSSTAAMIYECFSYTVDAYTVYSRLELRFRAVEALPKTWLRTWAVQMGRSNTGGSFQGAEHGSVTWCVIQNEDS